METQKLVSALIGLMESKKEVLRDLNILYGSLSDLIVSPEEQLQSIKELTKADAQFEMAQEILEILKEAVL